MADKDLTFLSVRGQRFIHLGKKLWRTWCRQCGVELTVKESKFGPLYLSTCCDAHKGATGERHANARAASKNFLWHENGQWVAKPAAHVVSGWGYLERLPESAQPSYAMPGGPEPASVARPEIEDADLDT